MKALGDGEIFQGELPFVERGNLRAEFEHARAPRDELLAYELIGALLADFGAPGQNGGANGLFILKLQLHRFKKSLLIGIKLSLEIFEDGVDCSDLQFHVGRIGCGFLKLILEQEAFELVVIDPDGNDDRTENVIAGTETAAHCPGGAFEAANGEKSVRSGANQKGEKPAEGEQEEAANFFRVFARLQVGCSGWCSGVWKGWSAH